ncbi:MAG: FAD-dependent oxidoreductase, partial [Candidatus Limnocylindrales bacterium]
MGYRIEIDASNCINCGICMDVCPVEAMDMTRPSRPGIEAGPGDGPIPWLMEHPVQVGECVGCSICIRECPVAVMTLTTVDGLAPLAPRQGPVQRPPAVAGSGWIPLSSVTREALKPTKVSPFAAVADWRTGGHTTGPRWAGIAQANPEAPCQGACPAGTDAGRYVGLIAAGRFDDAYAVAAEVNPFPSVCGWICTAPCEQSCRRAELDQPIAIRGLKRFAVEHGSLPPVAASVRRRAERIAIVGGGPAGMSAAYYLVRLGYAVTVFEAMPVPGGMMAIGIPSYRLPREALQAEIARIVDLGVELRLDAVMGRDYELADLQRDYDAVFLATGAPKSRPLGVSGDQLKGVVPATRFLKEVNLGPAPHLTGAVVVVGGGSTAMDAARSAWRSGATSVAVLYRRGPDEMPAQREEVEAARREGIEIRTGTSVTEVLGRDGTIHAVRVVRQAPSGEMVDRRPVWAPVPGSASEIPADTLLVAIGEEPDPSILPVGAGILIGAKFGIV